MAFLNNIRDRPDNTRETHNQHPGPEDRLRSKDLSQCVLVLDKGPIGGEKISDHKSHSIAGRQEEKSHHAQCNNDHIRSQCTVEIKHKIPQTCYFVFVQSSGNKQAADC